MELNDLYHVAEIEDIKIYNHEIENANGAFINYKDINAIVLDYKKLDTSTKEKTVLAEELGHYYCDATYSLFCTDMNYISKQEYKAKKWAFKALVSPKQIKKLISKGITYSYQIADELGVSEDLVSTAYEYYLENNYI